MEKQDAIDEFYANCKADAALCQYLWVKCEKHRKGDRDAAIFHYNRYNFEFKDDMLIVADDVYFSDVGDMYLDIVDVLGVCAWRIAENEGPLMTYTLYYRDVALGYIVKVSAGFPNFVGYYRLFEDVEKGTTEVTRRILEYMLFSIKMSEQSIDCEGQNDGDFTDSIESGEWRVVDKLGVVSKILIPSFCSHHQVIWRLG